MTYQVQRGDTIAHVTQRFNITWKKLREMNPGAVGRSRRTGRWFLKQGATLKTEESFETVMKQTVKPVQQQISPASSPAESGRTGHKDGWVEYTIKPGDTLWSLAVNRFHVHVEDLIRDNHIKDPRNIQPGQTIKVRRPSHEPIQEVTASWYGKAYHGKPMANGKPFNMYAHTIAHKELPFGTRVELKNPETGAVEKAVVTDRGPYVSGRDVDLSYTLAEKLSLVKKGVGKLVMKVL